MLLELVGVTSKYISTFIFHFIFYYTFNINFLILKIDYPLLLWPLNKTINIFKCL